MSTNPLQLKKNFNKYYSTRASGVNKFNQTLLTSPELHKNKFHKLITSNLSTITETVHTLLITPWFHEALEPRSCFAVGFPVLRIISILRKFSALPSDYAYKGDVSFVNWKYILGYWLKGNFVDCWCSNSWTKIEACGRAIIDNLV